MSLKDRDYTLIGICLPLLEELLLDFFDFLSFFFALRIAFTESNADS